MRRRKLKWLWARLAQLQDIQLSRDELLMKLGSAKSKVPAAWRLVDVKVEEGGAGWYSSGTTDAGHGIKRARRESSCT
jgi:hypothetical protein